MADSTSTPSSPRLMRPDFSVRHSPRLTNRKGVPTRIAPPTTAKATSPQMSMLIYAASCAVPTGAALLTDGDDGEGDALGGVVAAGAGERPRHSSPIRPRKASLARI